MSIKTKFIVAGEWRCKNSFPFSINQFNEHERAGEKGPVYILYG